MCCSDTREKGAVTRQRKSHLRNKRDEYSFGFTALKWSAHFVYAAIQLTLHSGIGFPVIVTTFWLRDYEKIHMGTKCVHVYVC